MQVIIEFLSTCIIDRNWNHFLEPYEEKTSYTFLGEGLFIYIYPNKLSIESLQLMFDLEEKEEIFKKWVFMIQ
jgi:hypothetical protein